jgi:hypothetical protein
VNKPPVNLPPNYRWNFVVFLVDIICFGVAFTFASVSSVIPSFVGQLTDSPPVIGMADVVFRGGWLLPQLVTSRFIIDWTLDKWFESNFPKSVNLGVKSCFSRQKCGNLNIFPLFGAKKCGFKLLGELFGGLDRSGSCLNYRIIKLCLCYPQKSHFEAVFP